MKPDDACDACFGFGLDGEDSAGLVDCAECDGTGLTADARARKVEARKRGRRSRRKGKRGEREIVHAFEAAGYTARRGLQSRDGRDAPDVIVDELPDVWVEVKTAQRPQWESAMRQAIAACGGRIPIVVTRKDRDKPYAHLELGDLLTLLRNARGRDTDTDG